MSASKPDWRERPIGRKPFLYRALLNISKPLMTSREARVAGARGAAAKGSSALAAVGRAKAHVGLAGQVGIDVGGVLPGLGKLFDSLGLSQLVDEGRTFQRLLRLLVSGVEACLGPRSFAGGGSQGLSPPVGVAAGRVQATAMARL